MPDVRTQNSLLCPPASVRLPDRHKPAGGVLSFAANQEKLPFRKSLGDGIDELAIAVQVQFDLRVAQIRHSYITALAHGDPICLV